MKGLPYYVIHNGRGFWVPTPKMKAVGFEGVACGRDGLQARALAAQWNTKWQEFRRSGQLSARINDPRNGFVYFLLAGGRVKIGFSTKPFTRTQEIAGGAPAKVAMLLFVPGRQADEKALHERFDSYRQNGEWFADNRALRLTISRCAMTGKVVHDGQNENEKFKLAG